MSSAALKKRPRIGCTPSVGKSDGEQYAVTARTGISPPMTGAPAS